MGQHVTSFKVLCMDRVKGDSVQLSRLLAEVLPSGPVEVLDKSG